MKQVTQRLRNGLIEVMDVPPPVIAPEGVLVDVRASLVSTGTERSRVEAARRGLIGKARARPDQARQVMEKARTDGVKATLTAVRTRLDQPIALGYSSAGVVLEVGSLVGDLRAGDRVACAGGGYAVHAELNYVPSNLCVHLPDQVSFAAGAFGAMGSIAMQGLRQADPRIGERVAVIGLGLVGQLVCRLVMAAGCEAVGIDLDAELIERSRAAGVISYRRDELDPENLSPDVSECDAIVITAATESDDPVRLAGAMARDRARVVVLGDVGMKLPRSSYYGKELELRMSRSYGPGRYDRAYEERGLDYPIGYVRWTERRNLKAFIGQLASGRFSVDDLITARTPVEQAAEAYERLVGGGPSPLGLILDYPPTASPTAASSGASGSDTQGEASAKPPRPAIAPGQTPRAGVIGAGSFAQRVLIPHLRDAGFAIPRVASAAGLSAHGATERFEIERAVTPDELLADDGLDVVCVASRHGSHADYAIRALNRGRAVFVEKPPAISADQLAQLRAASTEGVLQVGFNRRCAALARSMRDHIVRGEHPVELLYRIAAGRLAPDHWLNDPEDGGGRLIGEGCHFVDFACWFVGALPTRVSATIPDSPDQLATAQRFAVTLAFGNGSVATILYGSESAPELGKELIEAHSAGRSAVLDDFKRLELLGAGRRRVVRDRRRDKGHGAQFKVFRRLLAGDRLDPPSQLDTMAVTLDALATAGKDPSDNRNDGE